MIIDHDHGNHHPLDCSAMFTNMTSIRDEVFKLVMSDNQHNYSLLLLQYIIMTCKLHTNCWLHAIYIIRLILDRICFVLMYNGEPWDCLPKRGKQFSPSVVRFLSVFQGRHGPSSPQILACPFEYTKLGLFQTSFFSCAEPNVNEQNPLFELICIRFGAWEERRLN